MHQESWLSRRTLPPYEPRDVRGPVHAVVLQRSLARGVPQLSSGRFLFGILFRYSLPLPLAAEYGHVTFGVNASGGGGRGGGRIAQVSSTDVQQTRRIPDAVNDLFG